MVVYVEYVFLDNFIIDCMLISLARKSLGLQSKKMGIIISSTAGGLIAVFTPLLRLKGVVLFLLKIPVGLFIVFTSGSFKSAREYFKCFAIFLFLTFAFGGGALAVFWGLGLSFDPINYSHGGEVPLFIILSTIIFIYTLSSRAIKNVYRKKRITEFTLKCAVQIGGQTFVRTCFLDSGNSIFYKNTQMPVVVCSPKFARELEKSGALKNTKLDEISVKTLSGKCNLPVYKTEKFLIYNLGKMNIINNVIIGLSNSAICQDGEFDLIVGPFVSEVA